MLDEFKERLTGMTIDLLWTKFCTLGVDH